MSPCLPVPGRSASLELGGSGVRLVAQLASSPAESLDKHTPRHTRCPSKLGTSLVGAFDFSPKGN